jgi:hypothetical protein
VTTSAAAIRPRRRLPAAAFAASACLLAGGLAAAVTLLATDAPDPRATPVAAPAQPSPAGDASRLRTSFGTVSVDYAVRLVGARRPMGLAVPAGHLPVQVGVTVTNLRERPVVVDDGLLSLTPVAGGGMDPGRRTDGRLPGLTAHRFVLRYAVRRDAALPDLVVRDPARDTPLRLALRGQADRLATLDVSTHQFGGPVR